MSKKKIQLPKEKETKCQVIIHGASVAAGGAALAPIPLADTIPITAIQAGMIIGLGKVFEIDISESTAKTIAGCSVAQNAGRTIAATLLKLIPGVNILAPFVNPTVASAITEALGWLVAEDFYRISIGEAPLTFNNLMEILNPLLNGTQNSKKVKTKK